MPAIDARAPPVAEASPQPMIPPSDEPTRDGEAHDVDPPTGGRARWAWSVVVAIPLLALLAALALDGPRWRLDLGRDAALGHPRLFGLWDARTLILCWLVAPPLALTGAAAMTRGRRRRLAMGLFVAWGSVSLGLAGLGAFFDAHPHLLPRLAIQFLPYRAHAAMPFGTHELINDPDLVFRHRPGSTFRGGLDPLSEGDLLASRLYEPEAPYDERRVTWVDRRINKFGFAGEFGELGQKAPPIEYAFLGDSFTFGYGIAASATWPGVFLRELDRAGALDDGAPQPDPLLVGAEFACGNYSPTEPLLALEQALAATRAEPPRTIIVLFNAGNDVNDFEMNATARAEGRNLTTPFVEALRAEPPSWLENSSVLALGDAAISASRSDFRLPFALRDRPWDAPDPMPESAEASGAQDTPPSGHRPIAPRRVRLGDREFRIGISTVELLDMSWGPDWPKLSGKWDYCLDWLDDLRRLEKKRGVRVIVALIPTKLHLHRPHLLEGELNKEDMFQLLLDVPEWLRAKAEAEGSWAPLAQWGGELAKYLGAACAERDIEFLDLLPGMRAAAEREEKLLYFPYDTHIDADGQAVVGHLIADYVLGGRDAKGKPPTSTAAPVK